MKEYPHSPETAGNNQNVPYFLHGSAADIFAAIPGISGMVPPESEITAPGGNPHEYEYAYDPLYGVTGLPEPADAEQVRIFFDERRIDWEWGLKKAGHTDSEIGYDPKHIRYVVRKNTTIANAGAAPAELLHAHAELGQQIIHSETELRRLTKDTGLIVPEHFHVDPPYPTSGLWNYDTYTDYIYVQRLTGRKLDPSNPSHAAHAMRLGGAVTRYLADTPPGGKYASEYLSLSQWTVGRPKFKLKQPEGLYIHDVETVRRLDIRPPLSPDDTPEGYDDFEDPSTFVGVVEDTHRWIRWLPASPERDELLRTLDGLYPPDA